MKTRLLFFIGGVVAATFAKLASCCPKARSMAVKGLAKGMQATEKAKAHFGKIKEEAEEICKEAKECAEKECQCSADCACHQQSCEVPQQNA